jgi:hypothetical protein
VTKRFWQRTSRTLHIDDLDAPTRAAVENHLAAELIGDLSTATACCHTSCVPAAKPGLLARVFNSARDEPHESVDILLPGYLVAVTSGPKRGTHVRSARLDTVSLSKIDPALVIDSGVSVLAAWSGNSQRSSFYLGLGDDAAGRAFEAALHDAVIAAKRPR